ncbi:putative hydrolase [Planoprotostelium fungivorum]|uniref:Putative hydrolase n=1 Tax=Planoprotostelium fungivorum TaxID=1890364 RepID=A0A2P6NHQ9_9EUKA|nr:putative hydrolase [Planoprotostelium fungivorum]
MEGIDMDNLLEISPIKLDDDQLAYAPLKHEEESFEDMITVDSFFSFDATDNDSHTLVPSPASCSSIFEDQSLLECPSSESETILEVEEAIPSPKPTPAKRARTNSNVTPRDDKHRERLEANKRSAQLSRDRKKAQRDILESGLVTLSAEKKSIEHEMALLKTENDFLKKELVSLQDLVEKSPSLCKLMMEQQPPSTEQAGGDAQKAATWYTFLMVHMFSNYIKTAMSNQVAVEGATKQQQPNWTSFSLVHSLNPREMSDDDPFPAGRLYLRKGRLTPAAWPCAEFSAECLHVTQFRHSCEGRYEIDSKRNMNAHTAFYDIDTQKAQRYSPQGVFHSLSGFIFLNIFFVVFWLREMSILTFVLFNIIPAVAVSVIRHILFGAPHPSWTLQFNIISTAFRTFADGAQSKILQRFTPKEGIPTDDSLKMIPEASRDALYHYTTHVRGAISRATAFGNFLHGIMERDKVIDRVHIVRENFREHFVTHTELDEELNFEGCITGEYIQMKTKKPQTEKRVILYLHGGAHYLCSASTHRSFASKLVQDEVDVMVPDFRLSPEHPFPSGLHDAIMTYAWLIREKKFTPQQIMFAGESSGAGLALSALVFLRDHAESSHLQQAGGGLLWSPWLDLSCSGSSWIDNPYDYLPEARTEVLNTFYHPAQMYAGKYSLKDKLVGPIWHDCTGLPPLLVVSVFKFGVFTEMSQQTGTYDKVYSDSVTLMDQLLAGNKGRTREEVKLNWTVQLYSGMTHTFMIFPKLKPAAVAIECARKYTREVFGLKRTEESDVLVEEGEETSMMGRGVERVESPTANWI